MTKKDEKLLAEFELRVRKLMVFCDSLKKENMSLKQELIKKDSDIEALTCSLEQLKGKYGNLKLVKSFLSQDEESVQNAKTRLSKLVRDVDKCIAILKS